MSKLVGTTIVCTAGVPAKPCAGVFHSPARFGSETAREQWTMLGWTEVKLTGGVGYRCPLHSRFDVDGPIYLARRDDGSEAQTTMADLGIADAPAPGMHDGETQDLKAR